MFDNNYNCINHIGDFYSQYPFGDTVGKKPASYRNQPNNLQCKSTYWFLYDTSPHQRCLRKDHSILDVLLIRKNETYRKSTNDGVYLHWVSFARKNWKRATLCSISTRACKICSNKELSDEELKRIEREFIEIIGYTKWIVKVRLPRLRKFLPN